MARAKADAAGAKRAADVIDAALRACIEDFLTDYAHAIDDGRIEDWPGFFTEDGFYQVIARESFEAGHPIGVMHCEGRGMMRDRVKALREANIFEPHVYCHLLGRPRIRQTAPGVYGARSNFNVVRTMQDGGSALFASGKYLDSIVFEGASPRLKERRAVLDSRRIDILLVLPL
jgi:anthranilate 1,2-dioxygenase small subunit